MDFWGIVGEIVSQRGIEWVKGEMVSGWVGWWNWWPAKVVAIISGEREGGEAARCRCQIRTQPRKSFFNALLVKDILAGFQDSCLHMFGIWYDMLFGPTCCGTALKLKGLEIGGN